MINGWSTKRRAEEAGKIWVVQMYRMACGKDIEQPLTHTWQIETVFCSIICFWLIFLKLLKKCGLIVAAARAASVCVVGKINGFSLRLKTVWCLHTIDGGTKTILVERKTLLPQRVSPFAFKNPSSSLIWVASLHPAVTVVPGHEFGISAPTSTSCLATDNHRKVLMQSKIIGISSPPLAIINYD